MIRRIAGLPALVVLTAALAASPADATTYCVKTAAKQCKGTPAPTINAALNAAGKTAASDRVVLGEGKFSGAPFSYKGKSAIQIEGFGCGRTILTTAKPANKLTLFNVNAGKRSTLAGVEVALPNGDDLTGMRLHHVDAKKVCVTSALRAGGAVGVHLRGATLTDGRVFLPLASSGPSEIRAVRIDGDEVSKVFVSTLQARTAALVQADKAVLLGIDALVQRGVFVDGADSVAIHSSLFRLQGEGSRFAVDVINGTALANQLTVYAVPMTAPSVAFQARAKSYLRVSNTIARDVDISFVRQGSQGDASINARWDDLDLSTAQQSGFGSLTATNVVNVDPQFGNVKGGSFRLKDTSPLIDAGAPGPSLEMGEVPMDVDGRARIVDFDKDGQARRDLGAFERQLFLVPGKD